MAVGEMLVGELANETDILLDLLPLPLHLLYTVLAALVLQSLQDVLVLPDYLQQLAFAIGLVERFLASVGALLIEPGIGGLAA
jgi:hypothetical protein